MTKEEFSMEVHTPGRPTRRQSTAAALPCNDAAVNSVRSGMIITVVIQMGIELVAGILIHVLAATLIVGPVPIGIWLEGAYMYFSAIAAVFFVWKLHTAPSSQLSSHTDPDALFQSETPILIYFRNHTICTQGLPAFTSLLTPAMEAINAVNAKRPDLVKWYIICGLMAFVPTLAFSIYNLVMLHTYEERLKKDDVFGSWKRRGTLSVISNETVRSEAPPGSLNTTLPTPDQTLDTILKSR